jgi:gamma-glutamylcyclotransferase (GGCT)/AIG2-like uncharacterized protein YtfP
VNRLFVYGTLQPGDERWPVLAPYVDGSATADAVTGQLFDTGAGYPAALFGSHGTIHGLLYTLLTDTLAEALEALDHAESSVTGIFQRVTVDTHGGAQAWAYEFGGGLELTPIPSGRWRERV